MNTTCSEAITRLKPVITSIWTAIEAEMTEVEAIGQACAALLRALSPTSLASTGSAAGSDSADGGSDEPADQIAMLFQSLALQPDPDDAASAFTLVTSIDAADTDAVASFVVRAPVF